ncbi:L-lactate MFS transporter [Trichococcus patagoniensis]|nr:OFA family MFS transporter [Trichococcus patagoniensis]
MQQKVIAEKKVMSKARWLYVILGLVIMMALGTVYSWSVFRLPVEALYAVGAAQSGLPYMTALLFYSLFMFLTGRFFNTWSPRKTILTGVVLVSIGWILSAFAPNIQVLTVTYGVISGAGVGIAYGAPLTVVTRWFPEKKGLVIGLVLLGFGLSPLLTAPLARELVEQYGVTKTFLILGVVFGVLLPVLAMPFKYPEADCTEEAEVLGAESRENNMDSAKMVRSANFKGLYFNFIIGTMIGLMMIGLTSSIGIELIGMAQKDVVLFISMFAVFNGIGRPVFGWLTDRLSAKKAMLFSYAQIILAASLMVLAKNGSVVLFVAAFSIFWFNVGGWLAIAPTATNNMYGPKHYSQNYGVVFTAYGIGAVLGVGSSGLLLDTFQNYDYIFYLVIASCLIGYLLTLILFKVEEGRQAEQTTAKHLPDWAGHNNSDQSVPLDEWRETDSKIGAGIGTAE